jgi:hypothetical protein
VGLKLVNINNMEIKSTYVTFEQAKLLPQDVFNTNKCYDENGNPFIVSVTIRRFKDKIYYPRPEQWQVIEWLRVKYNIHVFYLFEITTKKYSWEIWDDRTGTSYEYNTDSSKWDFNSPQEAYSAAFDYTSTKLI